MPNNWTKGDKPLPLHQAFAQRIKQLWRGPKEQKHRSFILNPINVFKGFKKGAKKSTQHKNHATRRALGVTALTRIVNGPELNITLLGVPFLIHFGVDRGIQWKNYKKKKRQQAAQAQERVVQLQLRQKQQAINDFNNLMDEAVKTPLPHGPLSNEAMPFYFSMVRAGMSTEGAYKFCSGECEQTEISEVLSEEDCRVLMDSFGELLYPLEDEE
jgi:hypothetical protein